VWLALFALTATLQAQVPQMLSYQGRVAVGGTNFDGTGQFKFALVNNGGSQTYWSNGAAAVSLPVTKGLYSLLLGDTNLANMAALPGAVFTNSDVRLRVWFDDGVSGSQQLSPDQRLGAVGYALMANVADGSITSNKLAAGAVGSAQLTSNLTISGTVSAGMFAGNGAGVTNVSLVGQQSRGDWLGDELGRFHPVVLAGRGQPPGIGHGGGCQRRWEDGSHQRQLQCRYAVGADEQRQRRLCFLILAGRGH
jgi:hypothetical protein